MSGVFGEEWEAAKKELRRYWMCRCDGDVLLEYIRALHSEMLERIRFEVLRHCLLHTTMSGAVHKANRMWEWWWGEE